MKKVNKKRSKIKSLDNRSEYTDLSGRKWKENKICTHKVGCTCRECQGYIPGMG